MKNLLSLKQNKFAFSLSIIVSVFLVVSLVSAATTISTNISTAGTLTVSGLSTLGSAKIGSSGSTLSQVVKGSCVLTNYGVSGSSIDASHAASTTVLYQCAADAAGTAITGLVSGDTTFVQFATSTTGIVNGWSIVASSASTTDGYINVLVSNFTGTARVPSASGVGSSTTYIVIH